MRTFNAIILLSFLLISFNNNAQDQFTKETTNIIGVVDGGSVAGDFNGDGWMDFAMTGSDLTTTKDTTNIYYNLGGNNFVKATTNYKGLTSSSIDCGDYNNDGYLDIIVMGETSTSEIKSTLLYLNDENVDFILTTGLNLKGLSNGEIKFIDFNNDGMSEVLMSGEDQSSKPNTIIYTTNDKGNNYTEITNHNINNVKNTNFDVADFNKDGYIDIIITGLNENNEPVTKIYTNNGDLTFTELNGFTPIQLNNSDVAFGDYDLDGYYDFVLTGENEFGEYFSYLYKNNIGTSFTEITQFKLFNMSEGAIIWADINNDGYQDLIASGFQQGVFPAEAVYFENKGTGTGTIFNERTSGLDGYGLGNLIVADFNNDSKIDVISNGLSALATSETSYYTNNTMTLNTKPSAPLNLRASAFTDNSFTLEWDASNDIETDEFGISYDIIVSSTNPSLPPFNYGDVFFPMNDFNGDDTGNRIVVKKGATQAGRTSFTVNGVDALNQTYFVQVMALDANYLNSEFSSQIEVTAPVCNLNAVISKTDVTSNGGLDGTATVTISGEEGNVSYSWTNTGQTTATITGLSAKTYVCTITDDIVPNCTQSVTAVINEPAATCNLSITNFTKTDVTSNTGNDGTAEVNITGNQGIVTYSWTNTTQTSKKITNLTPGSYTVTVSDDIVDGCIASGTVVINTVTGIKELNNMYQINTYPNPISNELTIKSSINIKNGIIKIYNLNGKLVFENEFIGNQNIYKLDKLDKAIYYLELANDNELIHRSILSKM